MFFFSLLDDADALQIQLNTVDSVNTASMGRVEICRSVNDVVDTVDLFPLFGTSKVVKCTGDSVTPRKGRKHG